MTTHLHMRSTAHRVYLTLLLVAATLLTANPLNAGIILVGTSSGNDSVANVNTLITSYNSAFMASLPAVSARIDKLGVDSTNATSWEFGTLNNGQFDFFQAGTGLESKAIFDGTVQFASATLGVNGFSIAQSVLAFKYDGPEQFQYYVSKNGNGFSLWTFMSGADVLHPVYRDDDDGGFTRGDISSTSLRYDPERFAVSHISFYSAVPEPTSLVLVGLTVVGVSSFRRRRS